MTTVRSLYRTETGRYLTGWQLRRSFDAGALTYRLADEERGVILAEAAAGLVVSIARCSIGALPPHLEVCSDGRRAWVADRRRTRPSGYVTGRPTGPAPEADKS